jgi:hypothetical protein
MLDIKVLLCRLKAVSRRAQSHTQPSQQTPELRPSCGRPPTLQIAHRPIDLMLIFALLRLNDSVVLVVVMLTATWPQRWSWTRPGAISRSSRHDLTLKIRYKAVRIATNSHDEKFALGAVPAHGLRRVRKHGRTQF